MIRAKFAFPTASGLCLLIAASKFGHTPAPAHAATSQSYTLTVNSANPERGVVIHWDDAVNSVIVSQTTPFEHAFPAGTVSMLTAPAKSGNNAFVLWRGCAKADKETCTVDMKANTTVTAIFAPIKTFVLTVSSKNPDKGVAIAVSPKGLSGKTGGATSFSRTYDSGTTVTLVAPAKSASSTFESWTGCTRAIARTCVVNMKANATVTANYKFPKTYVLTVDSNDPSKGVAIAVAPKGLSGSGGGATNFTRVYAAGTTVTLTAPAQSGSHVFGSWTGCTKAISVTCTVDVTANVTVTAKYAVSAVTVDQSSTGPAITAKLLGMNMAAWFDPTNPAIVTAFQAAGIKAVRWPGGGWSDDYHWASNSLCGGTPNGNATFSDFVNDLANPGDLDIALTANYGTDELCTGPGDPAEAAAWATEALKLNANVSHITVGNEEYGSWETDMHSSQHDPATYASATATGYYPDIKAADPNVLVGVSINPGNNPDWDPIVLANAKYDFVEYHFYPQAPGDESDTFLVQQAAQVLTSTLETIKSELATAGKPDTPIYVGEIGSVYTNPGKQSTSITQALFAGQVLGEMMNEGVSRATWWIGFGGCSDSSAGNFSNSLYGWQDFGGYMVFSDGTPEYGCESATAVPEGTLLPTARAYQLFSKVAVEGESVLRATVAGDMTDVRAYAATHSGGTALVLFNLNETESEPVAVTLSHQSASSNVTVDTYSKAIYDLSKNNAWAAPTVTKLGAQSLPLTLPLAPWSINVVMIQ